VTGKYDPLHNHLDGASRVLVRLTFAEIERVLGDELPPSARKHQAWWANESRGGTHSHARSWLDAGYRTQNLDLNAQTVEFIGGRANRSASGISPPRRTPPAIHGWRSARRSE
jgi:hypothetical protein